MIFFHNKKKKRRSLKLNTKFTLLIIGCILPPVIIFCLLYYNNLEKQEISQATGDMEYTLNNYYEQVITSIESIDMSNRFVMNDLGLKDYLIKAKRDVEMESEDLMQFYNTDITALERMVNINPYVYQIRVYAESNSVQEMVPILYKKERIEKQEWYRERDYTGWNFGHKDMLSDSVGEEVSILSYVTEIEDLDYGKIGTVEVAMLMDKMFPWIYEEDNSKWSCFVDEDGKPYYDIDENGSNNHFIELLESRNDYLGSYAEYSNKKEVQYITLNDKPVIFGYLPIEELNGYVIVIEDITDKITEIHNQRDTFFAAAALIALLMIILINMIVKSLLKQFYVIFHKIQEVQKGNLNVVIEDCGNDEMGQLGTQINQMLEYIRHLMDDNIKRELLVKNSEIRALQNQINAHFIYNVLESIKMMAEIDEEYEISDAITTLGQLLRYSMKWTSATVTVADEINYIKNYLSLINLRFDYEIYLSLNIAPELYRQSIPKMSLQPIVENAIYHGIEQMAEDTNIYVKGYVKEDDCIIEITDSGKGMSEEEVERLYKRISGEIEASGGSGNGIGLKNVQDRIKMCFGEGYGIDISSKLGCYTKVLVRVPRMDGRRNGI